MGMGSLKRIAALCLPATAAVLACGAMNVFALTVPGTAVTLPAAPVTVPSPTVRVPSTAPAPPPAPRVATPAPSVPPVVKEVAKPVTDVVRKTTPKTSPKTSGAPPKAVPQTPQTIGAVTDTVPLATNQIKQTTGKVPAKATELIGGAGAGSGGGPAGPAGPVERIIGHVTGGAGEDRGAAGGGAAGGGAPGRAVGPDGTAGGSLATMLAGAGPAQLHAVLGQLEGCLSALPAVDRRVISMRAGVNGAPLTRLQIGGRLGLSRQAVRNTERRALDRLQHAAETTDCAATVVGPFDAAGIGNLAPQLISAGAVPVGGAAGSPAGTFTQASGIMSESGSPVFDLGGSAESGPAWAIVLFTVLFSVAIAALTRELRGSF